jgi:hypothetical protein
LEEQRTDGRATEDSLDAMEDECRGDGTVDGSNERTDGKRAGVEGRSATLATKDELTSSVVSSIEPSKLLSWNTRRSFILVI